jgi:hypothetical protein
LGCIAEYTTITKNGCYAVGNVVQFGAKRLTADMFSGIINNYYMKPSYKQPYYSINNVNISNIFPTTDSQVGVFDETGTTANQIILNVNRVPGNRYGNSSKVQMEIRYGKDTSKFQLTRIYVDYLKSPKFVKLTAEQVEDVEDTSQILEFPDYVCQEIVNELVKLIMENSSDPRLQTNIPINQSIAIPGQVQQNR